MAEGPSEAEHCPRVTLMVAWWEDPEVVARCDAERAAWRAGGAAPALGPMMQPPWAATLGGGPSAGDRRPAWPEAFAPPSPRDGAGEPQRPRWLQPEALAPAWVAVAGGQGAAASEAQCWRALGRAAPELRLFLREAGDVASAYTPEDSSG